MNMNRKCNFCGNEYYICRNCIRKNNVWKNLCCTKQCFIALNSMDGISPITISHGGAELKKVIFRVVLKKKDLTMDIVGVDFDLGKFDGSDGKTYTYEDFKYMYIPADDLKEIIQTVKLQAEKRTKATTKKEKTNFEEIEK